MAIHIRQREFVVGLGSAVVTWPTVAPAQQPAMPVIGFLGLGSARRDSATGRREFVISLKAAKALGITFPPGLLAIVDDAIE
jgi:hypothetical protein